MSDERGVPLFGCQISLMQQSWQDGNKHPCGRHIVDPIEKGIDIRCVTMRVLRHILPDGHWRHGTLRICHLIGHGSAPRDRRSMYGGDGAETRRDELHGKHGKNSQPGLAIASHGTMHGAKDECTKIKIQ